MTYLFLPGNTPSNKDWIDKLSNEFDTSKHTLHYDHWEAHTDKINFYTEIAKLQALDAQEEYIAICKSAGCFLALLANRNNILNIKKFFFLGFPYGWAKMQSLDVEDLLEKVKQDIVFIQKENDPAMPHQELKEYLFENDLKHKLIKYEREGEDNNNHEYEDTAYIKEIVEANQP